MIQTSNKNRLRVSLVIPAFNEEYHLRACLDAIAKQTVMPFEVIVADNNSTDRTAAIAAEFPFVRVVHAAQQGIVYARNAGFDAARGDIIGRIDADILIPHNWVEHIQAFYADPAHGRTTWSGCGYFYNVHFPGLVSWFYGVMAFGLNRLLLGHYTLWGSNMAILHAHWQAVRGRVCVRTDIHEDLDLAIHLDQAGYNIAYDTSIKTNAELRRVNTDHDKLWGYLQWWPRTLRIHGVITWPICWFFGAFLLYLATYILVLANRVSGFMRRCRSIKA
jgi:glycosyltransferase involved in cell wall biosynthesis